MRKVRAGFIRAGRLRRGEARNAYGMTGLGEAVLVRMVRYGVVWWGLMRRLWWGSLGRHRELHGGCGAERSVLVRLDMAVLIRHEQVRQGGVR